MPFVKSLSKNVTTLCLLVSFVNTLEPDLDLPGIFVSVGGSSLN